MKNSMIIFALFCVSVSPALAGNLVQNGSFELPAAPGGPPITDWTIVSGTVDLTDDFTAADGIWEVDLDGNSEGAIAQTISTVPGTSYNLTFDLAGNTDEGPSTKAMLLSVSDFYTNASLLSAPYTFNDTGDSDSDPGWVLESTSFTATSDSTTIEFASETPGAFGALIDNVGVDVPEPASASLLAVSVVGLMVRRRPSH